MYVREGIHMAFFCSHFLAFVQYLRYDCPRLIVSRKFDWVHYGMAKYSRANILPAVSHQKHCQNPGQR
ncbi:hypothetical protein BC629DRAFT_1548519, partial [Irpex lacteus]